MAAKSADLFADEGQAFEENDRGEQAEDHAVGQAAVADADSADGQRIDKKHDAEADGAAQNGELVESTAKAGGACGVVGQKGKGLATARTDLREIRWDESPLTLRCSRLMRGRGRGVRHLDKAILFRGWVSMKLSADTTLLFSP